MEIDKIAGLPAHPLFVHLPIVLIPLLAIWAVLLVIKPEWRERSARPLAIAVVIAAVATIIAAGAGEQLQKRVGEDDLVEKHAELGEQTRLLAILFAAAAVGVAIAIRRQMLRFITPLVLLTALLGVASTVWVARAGHAGAKSVWHEVADQPKPSGGD